MAAVIASAAVDDSLIVIGLFVLSVVILHFESRYISLFAHPDNLVLCSPFFVRYLVAAN